MNKKIYKSWTFYGALLLGAATSLEQLGSTYPVLMNAAQGLGAFLTVFGIRRALK